MADVTTILLAFISIGVTVTGGIISWIAVRLLRIDGKVQTLWNDYFGVEAADSRGFRSAIENDQDSMRAMLVEARMKHDSFEEFLSDLSDYLERSDDGNPPHIEDGYELDD